MKTKREIISLLHYSISKEDLNRRNHTHQTIKNIEEISINLHTPSKTITDETLLSSIIKTLIEMILLLQSSRPCQKSLSFFTLQECQKIAKPGFEEGVHPCDLKFSLWYIKSSLLSVQGEAGNFLWKVDSDSDLETLLYVAKAENFNV